jgi:hypothetical protein
MKRLIIKITVLAILFAAGILSLRAQSAPPKKTIKVKIYLIDVFESKNLPETLEMLSVEREVDAESPLRSAIEAQLAGATEEENSQLLYSPASGINLISLRLQNKTAYARFTRTGNTTFDKTDAFRFRNSVGKTALQFPAVRRIEICLDGVSDFWRVGEKIKHKKC